MDEIFIVTINGYQFWFEDTGFNNEQFDYFQKIAESTYLEETSYSDNIPEKELCYRFVENVKCKMRITLNMITISYVVRMH